MEVIQSFQVDHSDLRPGIYISREDDGFTTYDLRFTAPNRDPAIAPAAMHTIEHLGATYFRNEASIKDRIVYFGPMGCLTGFYLILKGKMSVQSVRDYVIDMLDFVLEYNGVVPGATAEQCGNYLLHDLPMAQWHSRKYLRALTDNFCSVYTMLEREFINGKQFHDA